MPSKALPAGLTAILQEMSRQHADALASFEGADDAAKAVAEAIRAEGRLILLGMGGSHAVNRIAECAYRRVGVAALSLPISEQLYSPLDLAGTPVLVTSQSGESVEVHRLLDSVPDRRQVFGLTLDQGSTLARSAPSLIGHGGTEQAFAATRSLLISLALHQRVLAELGDDPQPALHALKNPQRPDIGPAAAALAPCEAILFSGRILRGLAEAVALGMMELGRMPAYALEGGQFRHGPVEVLNPRVGVVVLRADEAARAPAERLLRDSVDAGSPTVLIDAGGEGSLSGAVQITLDKTRDVAAAIAMLPPAQELVIELARRRVPDVGTPRRSAKITRSE
jgi:fructoselysine-6-P-deglycase FrlB-like protein